MNRLGRSDHDFGDADPPVPYPVECSDCGFVLPQDTEPLPLCPGPREERSELKRTPLDPGRPPQRKTRLKPVSDTNSGGPETFGPLAGYARSLGCAIGHHEAHRCRGEVQAHHVRSRGAGHGDRTRGGHGNVVGLCWRGHHEIHTDGMHTFERRYSINLKARAVSIAEEFDSRNTQEEGVTGDGR